MSDFEIKICQNCLGARKAVYVLKDCQLYKCSTCRTLFAKFPTKNNDDLAPWASPGVSDAFMSALEARRAIQANIILSHYSERLSGRKLLDYACGQGIFSKVAIAKGFDLYGCDYMIDSSISPSISQEKLLDVEESWGWPATDLSFDTFIGLDVLEHIPDIVKFIETIKSNGVDQVLIKIPLLEGPGGWISELLAYSGEDCPLIRLKVAT